MGWNRGRGDYYNPGYRRNDFHDPCPPRSYSELLYATLKARFGSWSPTFLAIVERAYHGKIPDRISRLAERLAVERPWETPAPEPTGLPPTITLTDHAGKIVARWRPSAEEWREAGIAAGLVKP